ncbi:hypothetical protein OIU79_003557 [Salix purpurea]|uniref:Uncharacterized protein n=1 Tax=Salix purpurea TaxID=77065 RepID=A0A9Q0ZFH0_SALPP|nr:hypothetical protein OIU79_003557 [Salix purpurea]
MENTIAEENMALIPKDKEQKKGGLRTMPFIIGEKTSWKTRRTPTRSVLQSFYNCSNVYGGFLPLHQSEGLLELIYRFCSSCGCSIQEQKAQSISQQH